MESESPIPPNSQLAIILPNNFLFTGEQPQSSVNGQSAQTFVDASSFLWVVEIVKGGQTRFDIILEKGLENPADGPYSYSGFTFEF